MKLYPLVRYFQFFLKSRYRKGHGVHSPFFFTIINSLHRNKSGSGFVYQEAEARRGELLSDKRIVNVTDLGTGKSGPRRVCDIASSSAVNKKMGRVLSYFAERAVTNPIIELGTSLGISTFYMALSNPNAKVITIEGCPEIAAIAAEGFRNHNIDNIEIVTGNFDEEADKILRRYSVPGLVYIDGNHQGVALLRYFESVCANADENTVIIVDDINYSVDMHQAWEVIINDKRVTGSIDYGRFGIIIFREGIGKQKYSLRY